jgi:hypothetical protein
MQISDITGIVSLINSLYITFNLTILFFYILLCLLLLFYLIKSFKDCKGIFECVDLKQQQRN